jgi:hypothetical protein
MEGNRTSDYVYRPDGMKENYLWLTTTVSIIIWDVTQCHPVQLTEVSEEHSVSILGGRILSDASSQQDVGS